ncbi:hypothetical protein HMF7854_10605 [Sphingomonas ginkgonis]|uniref:Uncharacterized protein n=1 Tax=Sphingomonas ginkgonis TaxID=2315330 RepID=A0A3S0EMX6_9SPHN|nr:hypothetical protein [Sphingomonas ginkgonis]RST31235.1 hypothetical protein HMF7854_10605 [Sphingomonas ginkgonis]
MILLAAMLLQPPAIGAEQRARSPYLACAADVADHGLKSRRSAAELAGQAELKCEPLLEANVETSLAVLEQQRADGAEMSSLDRLAARDQLRTRLHADLKAVVVNRVTVQRAASGR